MDEGNPSSLYPVVKESLTTQRVPFWQGVLADIHVNGSGLVMFTCMAVGTCWPQYEVQATKLAALAGTYLFASAKAK